jgi:hypothetical protein
MSVVPILIRQHLIPFVFKESEGEEFNYGGKRGKSVLFSPELSSIGCIVRRLMIKAGKPLKVDNYNLYLSISDTVAGKIYQGQFYKHESGRNSFLMLPEEANKEINDLLEDMFRMAFVSYVNGCVENSSDAVVTKAIDRWIDKYDLLEFGYTNDTLRRLYYREKDKGKILARFQTVKSSKTLNYSV